MVYAWKVTVVIVICASALTAWNRGQSVSLKALEIPITVAAKQK